MTRETITLTQEEQRRAVVLTAIGEGRMTAAEGAHLLGLSLRHGRRLLARFRRDGPAGVAHGNRGRRPPNRTPKPLEQRIVRLARTVYAGFNHQHLTEHLADDHGIRLSRPTVHRVLLEHGLPSPRTRRPRRYRRRRERMPQAGLLVQVDASHHAWLEGRGPHLVLHGAIDDATSQVPAAVFRDEEDAHGHFLVLRDLVAMHGCPVALYSDRHGIFHKTTRVGLSLDEQLRGLRRPLTQFGRALAELGIRWIPARSPQAKGRVERLWGTFQDRLVSELRRARARTLTEANAVLAAFLPRYNARFAQAPADPASAYRPLPPALALTDVCCFRYDRTVANDNTLQVGGLHLQLRPGPGRRSYAKARVTVREHLDGTLSVQYHAARLAFTVLASPPPLRPGVVRVRGRAQRTARLAPLSPAQRSRRSEKVRSHARPAADHPWNRAAREALRRKQLRKARVAFSHFTYGDGIAFR
jgi:transposase